MKRSLLKHLYWIVPGIIIIFGLTLLFYQNFEKVTEQPEQNWSRGLSVGTTDVSKLQPIRETENGNLIVTRFENGKLANTTLNKEFVVQNTETFDIPVDKWTQVYQNGDQIIYFDYTNIYDKEKNEIVKDVEGFYPLKSTILYVKENVLYQLSPETKESTKLMNIDLEKKSISTQQNEDGIQLLTHSLTSGELNITIYQLNEGILTEKYQTKVDIVPGKIVTNIEFAQKGQKVAILLQEQLESPQGPPQFFNYLLETTISDQQSGPLRELTFHDPKGNRNLSEINSVELAYMNDELSLLFQANGLTNTQYNDDSAFNIYKAVITDNGTTTDRRSNTPAISTNPQWINNETVAWIDLDSDGNVIKISSSNIAAIKAASGFNSDDWLRALGKTLGMISSGLFAIAISAIWFIWPVTFIAIMHFFKSRIIQRDPTWIFYAGIGLYAIAALIWKDKIFVDNIYVEAPGYLTFDGSSYFYMLLFGIIAFLLVRIIKRVNDWDNTARMIYFVGIHIILVTTFFGPYLI